MDVKGGKRLPKGISLISTPNNHPYIRIRDLGASKILELNSAYEYVDDETQKTIARYIVSSGDILISIVGTIGLVGIVGDSLHGANQTENCVKLVNLKGIDRDYLYYFLSSNLGQNEIKRGIVGAVQSKLPIKNIENINIPLPSLALQKSIASILSSLDSKIELNRRINDNLEQQAQTLFKSWLVDFDPFKNGKFVESEMGMIPEGWKVISLQEYCQEITRGNIPTYVEKSNRPILNQKVNKGVSLEKQYYKYNSENVEVSISKMAHYGDVLLNSLGQGTLGRVHLYKEKLGNVIIDQFITILRTNLFVKSAYLSYTLNRPEYQTIIEGNVTGSTGMWVLTINNVRNIKIIVPKESCFLELAPIINSIYQAISNNTAEMEQLCTLRDCILPHLMSGELKINDLNC